MDVSHAGGLADRVESTLLKVDARQADIEALCREAQSLGCLGVCINPYWVAAAKATLGEAPVKVVTVIGFPLGATQTGVKLVEMGWTMQAGADELDVVMNVGALKSGQRETVLDELLTLVNTAHSQQRVVKVIVESAVLTEAEKEEAAHLVAESGADYLKTSTGYVPNDHLLEDVRLFRRVLPDSVGIKAAGGIRDRQMAEALVEAGAARLGTSSAGKILSGLQE
ncbi:MAG: deoxyribose-phosphate aldolase [Firmicutes bacterium]|nr:deoxyribose-phosphate aldolase [Bacillota bacterium]